MSVDNLELEPAATETRSIVDMTEPMSVKQSRIPVVIARVWRALLSDSVLGRQLRHPYWLPYQNYDNLISYEKNAGDDTLRDYLGQLAKHFRVYLQASDGLLTTGTEPNMAFTPLGPDRDHEGQPTICFTPEHHTIVEDVRMRLVNAATPSEDDITELRQMDFATAVSFLRELAHVVWRARYPDSVDEFTPEKFKAPTKSKAEVGQGEGGELIELALWGGVIDLDPVDLSGFPAANGIFYDNWCPERPAGDTTLGRYLCLQQVSGFKRNCLSRQGVNQLCSVLFSDATDYSKAIVRGPEIFRRLQIPQRAKRISDSREMLSNATSSTSIGTLDSNGSIAPLNYELPLDTVDVSQFVTGGSIRVCGGVIPVCPIEARTAIMPRHGRGFFTNQLLIMPALLGASSFGAGLISLSFVLSSILTGTALGVIIPEGIESLADAHASEKLPTSQISLSLIVGFTFMVVEQLVAPHSHSHAHSSRPTILRTQSATTLAPLSSSTRRWATWSSPTCRPADSSQVDMAASLEKIKGSRARVYPLTFGLIMHGLADGLALGVSSLSDYAP
ncbi:hypothetical protein DFH09DRAFT_1269812 [Mycena vulgaris]|nr:hypothetical protein DFH09DRAFT_1269812 [Mycena vulgaris]